MDILKTLLNMMGTSFTEISETEIAIECSAISVPCSDTLPQKEILSKIYKQELAFEDIDCYAKIHIEYDTKNHEFNWLIVSSKRN